MKKKELLKDAIFEFMTVVLQMRDSIMLHIYPVRDIKQHKLEGGFDCECNPEISIDQATRELRVKHNSYDNREYYEKNNPNYKKLI